MDRRHDIDWLRVLATLLLFVFHTGMVFSPAPFYHIRNDELSLVLLVVSGFISLWHMPLFFLLAGWSLHRSVAERGATGVLRERVRRLVVPLAAGIVLFMPLVKYFELSSGLDLRHDGLRIAPELQPGFRTVLPEDLPLMAPFDESFAEFLPTFFTRLDRVTWGHLWFIAYLFTFTVLYLPLLLAVARRRPLRVPASRLLVYAPILPLALVQLVLRPYWPGVQNLYDDWANFAYYSIYFWTGFLLARLPDLEALVHGEWRRALAGGAPAARVRLGRVLGVVRSPSVVLATSAVAGWCFVVAILGLGRRFLDFGNRALEYLSEAAFPVYVLHQAAIVVPGYFLLKLRLGVFAEFVLLLLVAVATTFALYELAVRRSPTLRVLFGMRPQGGRRAAQAHAVATGTLALACLFLAPAAATASGAPFGLWYAEGGAAQVEIEPCGEEICGRIVWLRSPFDEHGCALTDRSNPDAQLKGRAIVGLEVLRGMKPLADELGAWGDGRIYDPTSGTTYRCVMRLDGPDRLRVRGYYGIELIGRTTTWLRVGSEGRTCETRVAER
ncbi:MAG: DUF2147 domain-containing protein [Thermodesulfobacteriota bacterium]